MKQWEYKICRHDIKGWSITQLKLENWLNNQGSEGWQLVTYNPSTGWYYFKRQKVTPT